ncbi:uncharacterized protein LOC107266798 [Cephus cinctus]|uniref:Uncharacterized protein LOC107266798 n=1 Tax=Cephus cinctus TaxID=211228 RepID=A0AAJ7BS87_CEPCN|nr:uncharacterized protein LOC107266798 [Cephus cinctus]
MYAFRSSVLLALAASLISGCLCGDCDNDNNFISPKSANVMPQVVTYGEPCASGISLPYSVQIPKLPPSEVSERGRIYDYCIQGPASSGPVNLGFEAPIKIETPQISRSLSDTLRGRSYGVNVEKPQPNLGPVRHSFNFGIQKSVPSQRQSKGFDYGIEVQPGIVPQDYNFAPLPYAVQTPVEHRSAPSFLTGLTSKVDRILLPASEVYPCPPDDDALSRNSGSCLQWY